LGPEKDVLDSWKEIAAYIRRDVRTCQRWEKDLGLPVCRISGKPRARVYAKKAEIDRWLESETTRHGMAATPQISEKKRIRPRPVFVVGLAVLVVLTLVYYFLFRRPDFGRIVPEKKIRLSNISISPCGLAWSGRSFGVLWYESNREAGEKEYESKFFFSVLNQNGDVLVEPFIIEMPDKKPAALGCLAWNEKERIFALVLQNGDPADLFFLKIDEKGRRIGSMIQLTRDDIDNSGPVMVWTGESYALAWFNYKESMLFATLDPEGRYLAGPVTVCTGNDPRYPSLTGNDKNEFALAWNNEVDGRRDVYIAIIDPRGRLVVPPKKIAAHFGAKEFASIGWAGQNYGLSWMDGSRGRGTDIMFTRFDSSGKTLDPIPVLLPFKNADKARPGVFWIDREYYLGSLAEGSFHRNCMEFLRIAADGKTIAKPGFRRRARELTAFAAAKADKWLGLIYAYRKGDSNRLVFTGLGGKDLSPVARAKTEYWKAADESGKATLVPEELDDGSYSPLGEKITLYLENPGPYTPENGPADVHLFVKDEHGRMEHVNVKVYVYKEKPFLN
jgi:hypothetical protein